MNTRRAKKPGPMTSATYLQSVLVAADVPDPYEPEKPLRVMRNLREHPLHMLSHSGRINEAQRWAGEKFRAAYEKAVIGASIAIDYSRVRVDGGPSRDPLSETQIRAVDWLNKLARYPTTGKASYAILTQICGEGRGIAEVARQWEKSIGLTGPRAEGFVSGNLILGLDAILDFEGAVATGKRSVIRAEMVTPTEEVTE